MAFNVLVTQAAHEDLKEALEYISGDLANPMAATKLLDEVEACYEQLSQFPFLYESCHDNFIDPLARNFLDVDFGVYLREATAHRLPEYTRAQKVRDQFYSLLTSAQKETYEDITTYTSHLETLGPKLAHYYGYMLGNELLPRVVPGYHVDSVLTMRYTDMLSQYFGESFFMICST